MTAQFAIYFRCAEKVEAFSSAHTDALAMQSQANPQMCSEKQVRAWMVPRLSALIAAHVLTGVTQLIGAGRGRKTPVHDRNRKSFGHTTSRPGRTTKHV